MRRERGIEERITRDEGETGRKRGQAERKEKARNEGKRREGGRKVKRGKKEIVGDEGEKGD